MSTTFPGAPARAAASPSRARTPHRPAAGAQRGPDLPVPMDDRLIASQQELADAFSDAGVIPGRVRFADIVDHRFEGKGAAPM